MVRAIESTLDLPYPGDSWELRYRIAHLSGVLSATEDERGVRATTAALRDMVASVQGGAQ